MFDEILVNVLLVLLCYVYIVIVIFVSGKLDQLLHISRKTSRKFLHAMIGNLPFVIPFFTSNVYPVLVAAPFIVVTFLASPYTPLRSVGKMGRDFQRFLKRGILGTCLLRHILHRLGLVLRL
jgi:hypothetical protein